MCEYFALFPFRMILLLLAPADHDGSQEVSFSSYTLTLNVTIYTLAEVSEWFDLPLRIFGTTSQIEFERVTEKLCSSLSFLLLRFLYFFYSWSYPSTLLGTKKQ
ncbi:unnamed protein product [Orchesella dallaii]|uniref:Uncharacterized protein n=1 Tax=Orchesella dallaii TaxID=48710 RepID=A0ABP1Q2K9_9HEXA